MAREWKCFLCGGERFFFYNRRRMIYGYAVVKCVECNWKWFGKMKVVK